MDCESLVDQFESVLPLAAEWARTQEERILREGQPLSPDQLADAHAAGVRKPERVRLLLVEEIPTPPDPVLKLAAKEIASFPQRPSGLSLGYGVFLRADCGQKRHLILHEIAHISQYERSGGIAPFLRDYLTECAMFGYSNAPLEQEADEIVERICSA